MRQRLKNRDPRAWILLVAAISAVPGVTHGQYTPIYGGLSYDAATGNGYKNAAFDSLISVSDNGVAAGTATKFVGGVSVGARALRWDSDGNATELANLGTNASGNTSVRASSINASGQIVGVASKYVAGAVKGTRPVRWDSASGAAVELNVLGTDGTGNSAGGASAINASGQVAGSSATYVSGNESFRGVRWNLDGSALELGNLGTSPTGFTYIAANAINSNGQVSGFAEKYVAGTNMGRRAVRWDSAGNALELANLGTDSSGMANDESYAINDAGKVVGYEEKYVDGAWQGDIPVRWDSSGAVMELGNLGTSASGITTGYARAINSAGQAAGNMTKYVGGTSNGYRAVRWDTAGNPLELGNLGTNASGVTSVSAISINSAGETVGFAQSYLGGVNQGFHATYWDAAGSIVDLNTLISPTSNWTLTLAQTISDTGWVAGYGMYDPDGAGPTAAYQRHFLLDISPRMNWINAAGGSWEIGSNWSSSFTPGALAEAVFDLHSANGYTVAVSASSTIAKLIVRTDKLTVDIAAAETLSISGSLRVGETGNSQLTISGGGKLDAADVQLQNTSTLTLTPGGGRPLRIGTATIDTVNASMLDLNDNAALFTSSTLALVRGYIAYARDGGAWDRGGITSTTAKNNANHNTTLAVLTGSEYRSVYGPGATFDGTAVADADVLVKYTYYGDADFNGIVNFDDYARIDGGFNNGGTTWFAGDFDLNGVINFDDYALIDLAFNTQTGTLLTRAVPEPTGLGTLLVASFSLNFCRKRRYTPPSSYKS